ncbi:DsRNA-binding protein 5, putative isoform 1 [Hibiscus syriacus]|uniref:DsRNA-binding protein 5, putative isoform 1 n=1 Tax=Hibiscus syriacus TaxID=106335 RepID=A0A6A3C9M2_HIBSY|nr:uncharacterized protein LOC120201875 [Hibiscus syriacus]KAE8725900.1 DsRNA-binding protein 5, putative isoform 1 [Hibiscus syriacus]
MNQSDYTNSSIHNDVALKIASSLTVPDISSLSCCSRVWREIWGSDYVWEPLFKQRWPLLYKETMKDPNFKGWKGFYIKQHKEMRDQAESVIKFVEQCSKSESLQVNDHLKAVECLKSLQFGFKDVQMLLFKQKLSVLLNLVGLHYCLNILRVPASDVKEVLESSKIFDRQVHVKWWKLGRWFYGFRMRDEFHSRCLSLEDLATFKDDTDVLGVLHRGAIHEVLEVQISVVNSTSSAWLNLSSQ